MLLALLVPAIATLAAVLGRRTVTGDDVFVGYNPVEIARRGPITSVSDSGVAPTPEPSAYEYGVLRGNANYH